MSLDDVNLNLPDDFSGVVSLFPLPDLVLFPGVIQALHIFEQRYREMLKDALANDGLIAMSLLKSKWESCADSTPTIHSTVCIGRVVTHTELEDGRYNLLLLGVRRAKIVREIPTEKSYRMAEVTPIEDDLGQLSQVEAMRGEIQNGFLKLAKNDSYIDQESIDRLMTSEISMSQLLDLISFSIDLDPAQKQQILEAHQLSARAALLSKHLTQMVDKMNAGECSSLASYPPDFSAN